MDAQIEPVSAPKRARGSPDFSEVVGDTIYSVFPRETVQELPKDAPPGRPPAQHQITARTIQGVSVSAPEEALDPIAINRVKEPMWLAYVSGLLDAKGGYERSLLVKDACLYCNISPPTHNRYLQKHSGSTGEFEVKLSLDSGLVFVRRRTRPE